MCAAAIASLGMPAGTLRWQGSQEGAVTSCSSVEMVRERRDWEQIQMSPGRIWRGSLGHLFSPCQWYLIPPFLIDSAGNMQSINALYRWLDFVLVCLFNTWAPMTPFSNGHEDSEQLAPGSLLSDGGRTSCSWKAGCNCPAHSLHCLRLSGGLVRRQALQPTAAGALAPLC